MCPEPESPEHGSVTLRGNLTAGTEALFSCDPGHQLLGDTVTRCRLGGSWEAPPPVCRLIDCGRPPEPTHGTRTLNGGTLLGDVATFSCPEGYNMTGSRSRSCLNDGTWSGEPAQCSCEWSVCVTRDKMWASVNGMVGCAAGLGVMRRSLSYTHCGKNMS